MRSWVLTDDKVGTLNQCIGLAEALGSEPEILISQPRLPWRWLPQNLWFNPLASQGPGGARLQPPWPDIVVTCGRSSVAPAAAIGPASGGQSRIVSVQNPKMPLDRFDLVIAPIHDRVSGPNVLVTLGAIHRLTPERLAAEATRLAPTLAYLPRPLVAVLLGGSNRRYRMTPRAMTAMGETLRALARAHGAGLALTPSRRTDPAGLAALRAALGDTPAYVWEGQGQNPYFGLLGLADAIVVTEDSVSMTSEACSTGKPVFVASLEGDGAKFAEFQRIMRERGYTRALEGRLSAWDYPPLDETARVAELVQRLLKGEPAVGLAAEFNGR